MDAVVNSLLILSAGMNKAIDSERPTSSNLADTCGAVKLFVTVATISTDAFRFSAIR
jgi:hypothetical protein